MEYTRVNWQNTNDTPVNATNLNKMDKAIAGLVNELNGVKHLESLAVFPNQSNSRISNSVNFKSTNGYTLTYGALEIADSKLIVTNEEYASTQLTAMLNESVVLNCDKNILLKIRAKASTNTSIYPKLGLADGTSVFVPSSTISAGNLNAKATPYYNLAPNKWEDIWCIIGSDNDTKIESIVLHIAPYTKLEISSMHAFYSLDKCTGGGVAEVVTAYTHTTTPEQTFTPTQYEEGEI
ncbi:MAG: hypothetical protein UD936_08155 [Acutalibacteraceae bacterium]|nr:hypothetical protein [Acutalibacteraceae bacterium]